MLEFLFTKTPLIFFTQSLWRDEAFTYFLTKNSIAKILYLSAKDFTPPLHALLLKFWIWIFGSSEIAMRSLSLIFYVLTAIVFFLFIEKIFKIKNLWKYIYFLLFLLNPMLLYFSFEARTYSLMALISILSFYLLIQKKYKPYVFVSILGLYTHYFMLLILGCQALYIFLVEKKWKPIFKKILLVLLIFIPWILYSLKQNSLINEPFWINPVTKDTLKLIPSILYSGYESGFYYLNEIAKNLNVTIFIYLFIGVFLCYFKKLKNKKIFYLLIIWSFLPVLITLFVSNFKPLFLPRYLILSTPGLMLLLVYLNKNMGKVFKYVLIAILIIQTFNYMSLQSKNRKKAPYKTVITHIKKQANPNDLLYVLSELDYHVAKYYYFEDKVFIYNKDYKNIPNFAGKALIPQNSIKKTLPSYPEKAYILHPDLTYDIKTVF
ncbi:MAG: EpsG family protein [bacterium]